MVTRRGIPEAKQRLADVPQDKVFWCRDGRVLKNLSELARALKEMSDDTFSHHAGGERNDFSNWVRDVIGDTTLARDIQKVASCDTTARKVEARIAWLRARL